MRFPLTGAVAACAFLIGTVFAFGGCAADFQRDWFGCNVYGKLVRSDNGEPVVFHDSGTLVLVRAPPEHCLTDLALDEDWAAEAERTPDDGFSISRIRGAPTGGGIDVYLTSACGFEQRDDESFFVRPTKVHLDSSDQAQCGGDVGSIIVNVTPVQR